MYNVRCVYLSVAWRERVWSIYMASILERKSNLNDSNLFVVDLHFDVLGLAAQLPR